MKYILIILLFLASCSKDVQQPEQRMGGALEDKPNNVPVLVSKGFTEAPKETIALRGKPVKGDNVAPTVYFISPVANASVSGTVSINISATDKVGVTSTSIAINDSIVTRGTFYQWNTTGRESGLDTLTATASDAAGNKRSVSITVLINAVVVEPPVDPSTEVSLTMPPVGNQGSEGSCVAFSVGYAARSVDWYYKTKATAYSYSTNIFSPEFLYNPIKFSTDCAVGTAMQTALEYIMSNGIPTFATMPYTDLNCSLLPTATQTAEALNYKIAGFNKIYTSDRVMIRSMINSNKAVIVTIIVDNSFMQAKAGFIWRTYSGSGSLGHSVVICGYDDSKNAWKIMNSWGNLWGDAGYSWIDYDFFPTRTGTWCYAIN